MDGGKSLAAIWGRSIQAEGTACAKALWQEFLSLSGGWRGPLGALSRVSQDLSRR